MYSLHCERSNFTYFVFSIGVGRNRSISSIEAVQLSSFSYYHDSVLYFLSSLIVYPFSNIFHFCGFANFIYRKTIKTNITALLNAHVEINDHPRLYILNLPPILYRPVQNIVRVFRRLREVHCRHCLWQLYRRSSWPQPCKNCS